MNKVIDVLLFIMGAHQEVGRSFIGALDLTVEERRPSDQSPGQTVWRKVKSCEWLPAFVAVAFAIGEVAFDSARVQLQQVGPGFPDRVPHERRPAGPACQREAHRVSSSPSCGPPAPARRAVPQRVYQDERCRNGRCHPDPNIQQITSIGSSDDRTVRLSTGPIDAVRRFHTIVLMSVVYIYSSRLQIKVGGRQ